MGEALLEMYATMTAADQKKLYDFALFIVSRRERTKKYTNLGLLIFQDGIIQEIVLRRIMKNLIGFGIIMLLAMNCSYAQNIEVVNKNELVTNNFKTDLELLVNFNPSQSGKMIFSESADNIEINSIYTDGDEIIGTEFDDEITAEKISKITSNERRLLRLLYSADFEAWILFAYNYDNDELILKSYAIPVKAKCIEVNYSIHYITEITEDGDYILENSKIFNQIFYLR